MTTQDLLALGTCAAAFLWLLRRLLVKNLPPASRPDVTPSALVKRTRRAQADAAQAPAADAGPSSCGRC